jgi:hypothetical protein
LRDRGYGIIETMAMQATDELARFLRTWRDRLTPEAAGLPAGGVRRAPGLRREEVAQLAGLSVDYLARLEQGRARHPSPSVLTPLARALRLTDAERAHLFRVAGQAEPGVVGQFCSAPSGALHSQRSAGGIRSAPRASACLLQRHS